MESNSNQQVLEKLKEEYNFFSLFEKDPMMREISLRFAHVIEYFDPEFERKFYCGY